MKRIFLWALAAGFCQGVVAWVDWQLRKRALEKVNEGNDRSGTQQDSG